MTKGNNGTNRPVAPRVRELPHDRYERTLTAHRGPADAAPYQRRADRIDQGSGSAAHHGGQGAKRRHSQRAHRKLAPVGRAAALYARGTADLFLSKADSAQESLAAALAAKLPAELVPFARNNLAVALARTASIEAAVRELQAVRAAPSSPYEATLNLGVLRDQGGRGAEALVLYDEYVKLQKERSEEIAERADALRKAYP